MKDKKMKPRVPIAQIGAEDLVFCEQVKAMRAKVDYRIEAMNLKIVAISSAISGEGKTVLSGKLAIALAASGRKRVLLIDTDIRKADLGDALGLESNLPGLTEYLLGNIDVEQIIRPTGHLGFSVIPAGLPVSNSHELLAGDRFRNLLTLLADRFDLVLLDTPPILAIADTLALRDKVDGFILVYRAAFTPFLMFRQSTEEIGEKYIVGVVINGVEPHSQRYYDRYYGQYYKKLGNDKAI